MKDWDNNLPYIQFMFQEYEVNQPDKVVKTFK